MPELESSIADVSQSANEVSWTKYSIVICYSRQCMSQDGCSGDEQVLRYLTD